MSRRNIGQLKDGEKVEEIYRISDKQLRSNKNGNLYLQFNLSDRTGVMSGRLWNIGEDTYSQLEGEEYVLADCTTQRFQGVLQLIAKKLTKIDPKTINVKDFVRTTPIDIPKLLARLKEIGMSITNGDLRNLADCFLIDEQFMAKFAKAPAGVKLHHAYPGGLLDHSVQMMEVAVRIASLYSQLNRDLLVIGAFLHDIGKTEEMRYETDVHYSSEGQLLGHPLLGIELLHDKIREAEKLSGQPFDPELAMTLKHLLISHHGTYENQSAKLPMTLEAMTLHFIDSIDSKIAEFQKYMDEDANIGSPWTSYIPAIERKLFKGSEPQS